MSWKGAIGPWRPNPCSRQDSKSKPIFIALFCPPPSQVLPHHIKMSYCGSVCTVPCGAGYGVGGAGSSGLVPLYGGGTLSGLGGGGLGYACSTQLPGSQVVIQPPSSLVSVPGATISATSDPVAVGQIPPSYGYGYPALGSAGGLSGGSSYGGYGRLGYGGGYGGGYGYCGGYGSGYGNWRRYSRRCLPYYSADPCGPC